MSPLAKWSARVAAVAGSVALSVLLPVAAWASSGPGAVVVEAARRRPRGMGFFGFLGTLCCLVVVGIVVVLLLLLMRNRRSGPRR